MLDLGNPIRTRASASIEAFSPVRSPPATVLYPGRKETLGEAPNASNSLVTDVPSLVGRLEARANGVRGTSEVSGADHATSRHRFAFAAAELFGLFASPSFPSAPPP